MLPPAVWGGNATPAKRNEAPRDRARPAGARPPPPTSGSEPSSPRRERVREGTPGLGAPGKPTAPRAGLSPPRRVRPDSGETERALTQRTPPDDRACRASGPGGRRRRRGGTAGLGPPARETAPRARPQQPRAGGCGRVWAILGPAAAGGADAPVPRVSVGSAVGGGQGPSGRPGRTVVRGVRVTFQGDASLSHGEAAEW